MNLRKLIPFSLASLAIGCGDPIVDGSYRGDPILLVEGQMQSTTTLPEELRNERFLVSIFWLQSLQSAEPTVIEQPGVTTELRFPTSVQLRVFRAPQEQHYLADASDVALGVILVYVDSDRDGRYHPSGREPIVGGSLQKGLAFARIPTAGQSSPTGETLPAGFSLTDAASDCNTPGALPIGGLPAIFPSGAPQPPNLPDPENVTGLPGLDNEAATKDDRVVAPVPPEFGCLVSPECPKDFRCDRNLLICVPVEPFMLTIDPDGFANPSLCR